MMADVIVVTAIKHQRRVIDVCYSASGRVTLTDLSLFFSFLPVNGILNEEHD